jgi:hypothetical protein
VTDSHGRAQAQLLDDVGDVAGVGRDGVGALRLVALAAAAQVDGHDPMPPREMLGLEM